MSIMSLHASRIITGALIAVVLVANRPAAAQQPLDEARAWQQIASALEPGSMVDVRLKNGTKIRGTVMPGSTAALILKPYTRIPVPARSFAYSDIERIERWKRGMRPGYAVLLAVSAGAGAMFLGAIALLATAD
jgi:hypothetical protein